MNRLKRGLLALGVTAAIGASTAACGAGNGMPDVYETPQYVGANGQCYVLDPSDLWYLQHAGLCPIGWQPALMPVWFETRYYGYVQHTVVTALPPARQKVVIKQVNNFYGSHKSDVEKTQKSYSTKVQKAADTTRQQQSTSTYKPNNGDTKQTTKVNTQRQKSSTTTYKTSRK